VHWIIERTLNVVTPFGAIVNVFARHAVWIAVVLFLLSLALRFLPAVHPQRAILTGMAQLIE
jgi:hypothetical protein